MTISIKPNSQKMKCIQLSLANTAKEVPEYMSLDDKKFSGQLLSMPTAEQIPLPITINIPLVSEFLAHNC
jgi:small subunit ribosomal protein S4